MAIRHFEKGEGRPIVVIHSTEGQDQEGGGHPYERVPGPLQHELLTFARFALRFDHSTFQVSDGAQSRGGYIKGTIDAALTAQLKIKHEEVPADYLPG